MILMKDIIVEGNPILRMEAKDVELPLNEEDEKTLREMLEYVDNSCDEEMIKKFDLRPSVGIAAPQIAISKKLIAIIAPDEHGVEHTFALINPKLISYSDELTYLEGGEGCLSVVRKCDALIHRPKRVTFEAYFYDYETRKVEKKRMRLKGYLAVVFQHEFDHLKGILFVDKANPLDPYKVPENSTPVKFDGE